jgi:hypothetical protein
MRCPLGQHILRLDMIYAVGCVAAFGQRITANETDSNITKTQKPIAGI